MTPDARRDALERQRRMETLDIRDLRVALGGTLAAGVGAIVLCVYLLVLAPMGRYDSAVRLMQEGNYASAQAAFSAMGSYRDAKQRIAACAALEALQAGDTAPLCGLLSDMDAGDRSALSTMLRDAVSAALDDWEAKGIAAGDVLTVLSFGDVLDPEGRRGLDALGVQVQLSMTGEDVRMHMQRDIDADRQDELVILTDGGEAIAYSMTQTGPQEKAMSASSRASCLSAFAETAEKQGDGRTAMDCALAAVKTLRSDGAVALFTRIAQNWAKQQQKAGSLQDACMTLRDLARTTGDRGHFEAYYDLQRQCADALDPEAALALWSSFCGEEASRLEAFGMAQKAQRVTGELRLSYARTLAARGDGACLEALRQAAAEGADVKEALPELIGQYPAGLTRTMLRLLQAELSSDSGAAEELRAQAGQEAAQMLGSRNVNGMNGQDVLRMILLCEQEQLSLDGMDVEDVWRRAMTEASAGWALTEQTFVSWDGDAHEELLGVDAAGRVVLLTMAQDALAESASLETGLENAQLSVLREEEHLVLVTDGLTGFSVFACGSDGMRAYAQETGLAWLSRDGQAISYGKTLPGSIPRSSSFTFVPGGQESPECTGMEWGRERYPYPEDDAQLITRWFEAHAYGIAEEKQLLTAQEADAPAGRSPETADALPVPDDPAALEMEAYQETDGLSRWMVGYTSGGVRVNVHVSCRTEKANGTERHVLAGASYALCAATDEVGDTSVALLPFGGQVKGRLADKSDAHAYRLLLPVSAQVQMRWQAGDGSKKGASFAIRLYTQEDRVNPCLEWQTDDQAATQVSQPFYLRPGVYYAQVLPVSYRDTEYTLSFTAADESHAELEPNNTTAQATPVGLNETFYGTLQTVHSSGKQTADDVDLYAFTLEGSTAVSLQLEQLQQASGSAQRLVVSLHGGEGGKQMASASIEGGAMIAKTPTAYLDAGTYYALVRKGSSWYGGVYGLTVCAAEAENCETEPNDTVAQANPVMTNTPVTASFAQSGDTDVFAFTLSEDALVQPVMSFAPLSGSSRAYTLRLLGDGGELLQANIGGRETDKVIRPLVLCAGQYHVQLANVGSEESGSAQPYTLMIKQAQIGAGEREPNDSAAAARPVALGEAVTGSAASQEDEDWFALTLDQQKNVILRVSVDGADTGSRIYTVSGIEKGETYLNQAVGVSGFEVELLMPAGTYYFRIRPAGETMAWYTMEFTEK